VMINIFIATCIKNKKAELALKHSILKHTKSEVCFTWMRNGDNQTGWNEKGWGTGFTPFRWLTPKLCNFTGKAIYLDVDTLVRSDIKELWDMSLEGKAVMSIPGNYSVMLLDCSKFYDFDIDQFKQNSCFPPFSGMVNDIISSLEGDGMVLNLPPEWNCLDGKNTDWNTAKIIHYTEKSTQPWRPYPESHKYKSHPIKDLQLLWEREYKEAVKCGLEI